MEPYWRPVQNWPFGTISQKIYELLIEISWKFVVIIILIIQTCHNLAYVTTVWLSWHVKNYDMIGPLLYKYELHDVFQTWITSS